MRIINIVDFFHPCAGYENNILPKYLVKNGHEVLIITSEIDKVPNIYTSFFGKEHINDEDNKYYEKTGVKVVRVPIHCFISGRAWFKNEIFIKIREINPDLLFLCGNDTLISILYLLRYYKERIPLVLDSHMLEMASKNPFNKLFRKFYRYFVTPIILKNNLQVIRLQDDLYVQKCLGIPLRLAPFISFGTDTMIFHPDETVRRSFRINNNIKESDFVVLYAGKLDEEKGGKLLAQVFEKRFDTNREIILVVVGNTNGKYGIEVDNMFSRSNIRIIRYPTQKYSELPRFYQMSDLVVYPKQCSLSFYDAQACGIPVISEDNNINVDRLKYGNGFNFRSGDVNNFREKIKDCSELSVAKYQEMKINAHNFIKNNYDYNDIAKVYMELINSEYERQKRIFAI